VSASTPHELVRMREAAPQAVADVAAVMRDCEDYYLRVQGRPADEAEVANFFRFEVPGIPPEDGHAYVVRSGGVPVGLASLVLGWKRPGQSMVGLLAIAERHRGRGLGRAAYDSLEAIARGSRHGASMRIGIVATNTEAFPFWRRLGFRENGEVKRLDAYIADIVILEKDLDG
jgi:GNAT superfamily N-acetyltransferase